MALAAAVLRLDANGNPRTARLLAALVEAESCYFADAATKHAEDDLVRAFRGGATPAVPIAEFLERIQRCNYLYGGAVYVLAGAYLVRFMRSRAARDAGILVEPATAHRLVAVSVLLGAKFTSPRYFRGGSNPSRSAPEGRSGLARCANSNSSSSGPSTTESSSGTKSSRTSSGSWSAARGYPVQVQAARPRRGRRRRPPRRLATFELASCPSSRLSRVLSLLRLFRVDRFLSFLDCILLIDLCLLGFQSGLLHRFAPFAFLEIELQFLDFFLQFFWISLLFGLLLKLHLLGISFCDWVPS